MNTRKWKWNLLFSYIKSNRSLVTVTLFCGLIYNVFTLLIPIGIGRFYEFNFDFSSQRLKIFEKVSFLNTDIFIHFLLFFVLVVLFLFIFEYINSYLISIIGESFTKNLREQLFEHQMQISSTIYDQKGIGKYLLRHSGDLKSIQNYISLGLFKYLQDVLLILFLLAAISFIDIYIGIIFSVFLLIANIILFFLNKTIYKISLSRRNQRSGLLTFVNTRLQAIASVKAFNKYYIEQKKYVKRSEKLYLTGKKYQAVANLVYSVIPAITYLMIALLMWYVYYLKTKMGDAFKETSFLVLILLIISFLPILRRTLRVSIVWKLGNISFEKLLNIHSFEAENKISQSKRDLSNQIIRFKNVDFKYPNSPDSVFKNLNISFSPGETTAIIGDSGSGKSTFINLLLKIYQPVKGDIYYGKYIQNKLSEKTIRRNISVVSEDFPLYGKTVYEAITYSRKKTIKQKAEQLLNEIQKYENERNKLKLQDSIGELGKSLTSGQKRILMYCRMFLSNKPWFLINAPLKDLKSGTANHIIKMLNELPDKKSLIIFDSEIREGLKMKHIYFIKDYIFVREVNKTDKKITG